MVHRQIAQHARLDLDLFRIGLPLHLRPAHAAQSATSTPVPDEHLGTGSASNEPGSKITGTAGRAVQTAPQPLRLFPSSSLYPLPSKWTAADSRGRKLFEHGDRLACSFGSPLPAIGLVHGLLRNSASWSAYRRVQHGHRPAAVRPTTPRRGTRSGLPVKANGDVRLRSVLSISNSGI